MKPRQRKLKEPFSLLDLEPPEEAPLEEEQDEKEKKTKENKKGKRGKDGKPLRMTREEMKLERYNK